MDAKSYYLSLDKETISCPMCNSSDVVYLGTGDRYNMGLQTESCNSCGLIFINPRPTQTAMNNFYRNHYRSFYESVEQPDIEYVQRGPFQARAHFVVAALKEFMTLDDEKKVLDVGCAEGTLLKNLKNTFPKCEFFGLEPNPKFAAFAKGHAGVNNIYSGTIEEFYSDSKSNQFDVITITHVLEHMPYPVETLILLKKLLKPEGLIYVEVPNVLDSRVKGLGHIHLAHLISFYPKTFHSCMQRAGFNVLNFCLEGLPALCPSIAIIATPSEKVEDLLSLSIEEIKQYQETYQKQVFNAQKINHKKSFSQRLRNKLSALKSKLISK